MSATSSRDQRGPRRPVLVLLAVPVAVAAVVAAVAILSGAAVTSDNSFTVQGCSAATVGSFQTGTTSVTTDGATTVAVTAVDPSRSLVLSSSRSDATTPGDALVRVELTADDTITITRNTATATPPPIEVAWTIVEWDCGVRVQRGTVSPDGAGTSLDVDIDSVDLSGSFAVTSVTPDRAASQIDGDDQWTSSLVDATTLRLWSGAAASPDVTIGWQVVEMSPSVGSVQQVAGTLSQGATSTDLTLATSVDPTRTLLLVGARSSNGWRSTAAGTARAELVDGATVRVSRRATEGSLTVGGFVVSFEDGTSVQQGTIELAPGEATGTAAIGSSDPAVTGVLSTTTTFGGQAWGSTDTADTTLGEGQATFVQGGPDEVVVTRSPTSSTARFTYQAVRWGATPWWDTAYAQRRQLTVETSSAAAPDGYTVPVTIDHAALVAAGESLATGDDVRVLHHDGATWTELDRVLAEGSSWDAADTTIEFRTVDPVAADATDASYWLYVGDPTATSPPADPRAVYALDDDFEDGTLAQFSQEGPGNWFVADPWSWRAEIRIEPSFEGQPLVDFPVLVELTSTALRDAAQADAADVRFTAADGVTPLAHEVASYDAGTGTLRAWVEVPEVQDANGSTWIFAYAGSANAPAQQDVRGTWDNGFVGVWHLDEDPTGPLPHAEDSSPQGRDGAATGTTGLVATATGGGLQLDGAGGVEVGDVAVGGTGLTVSALVTPDAGGTAPVLVARGASSTADLSWGLSLDGTGPTPQLVLDADTTGAPTTVAGGDVPVGATSHVAAVFDGATASTFVDGAMTAGGPVDGLLRETAAHEATLGRHPQDTRHLDGVLDEVRVSSVVRSDRWLRSEAENLDPGSGFVDPQPFTAGTWFDQGTWASRAPVAVPAGTTDSDLTDFPLLIDTTIPDLATAQASGADIVVTAADGTTRLDHEIESFDRSTGTVQLWVRVPTLSAAADTRLFLYWGNPTAEDWQDPAGVWGDDARAVLHLGEAPDG